MKLYEYRVDSFVQLLTVKYPWTRDKTGSNTVLGEHLGGRQVCLEFGSLLPNVTDQEIHETGLRTQAARVQK